MATDIPFWRKSTGAEQRMASLVRFLGSDCFEVRTFYLGQTETEQFTVRDRELIASNGLDVEQRASDQPPRQLLKKMGWYAEATKHQLQQWSNRRNAETESESDSLEPSAPPALKEYRWPWAISAFRESIEAFRPNSIIIQYVKLDYLLEALSYQRRNEIHCLVDTHDVLHLRARQFRDRGFQHWIEISREEEALSLAKFDSILAIQSEEANLFREMAPESRIIVCGHAVEPAVVSTLPASRKNALTIGYIGSANASNAQAIESFLENVWRRLLGTPQANQIRMVIAGGICDWLNQPERIQITDLVNVEMLGRVEALDTFYDSVDVVVNPVEFGTGLKIKNCEAIGFGKPVLTTTHGSAGLPPETEAACRICENSNEFLEQLLGLASDSDLLDQLQSTATKLSQPEFSDQRAYSELKRALLQGK
jgi:glycosyltransferase involved in cell wall biosynthesis